MTSNSPFSSFPFDYATKATSLQVASPCVSICNINDSGLCEGCFRTIDEIREWGRSDDAAKQRMWTDIRTRLTQTHPDALV